MRAVVTGGSGFLGSRIVALLCARGDDVRVIDRTERAPSAPGASAITADVRDVAALERAFAGADVVYHVAGKVGFWGPKDEFWSVNVDGTRAAVAAARRCGVARLVYTSTPSVVGYADDVENGGQELPYPAVHENAYAASKCAAERLVLAANGGGMTTVALRPHVLIGPGDRRMLPNVVRRAARGRLRIIGDGGNKIDLTDVDNAAWAHLDAADALTGVGAPCAGKAYFISNGQPVVLWEWLNELLDALDLPGITRSLSFPMARLAGLLMETAWSILPAPGDPPLTRALATVLARSHWYDLEPARRDLGYRVRVPMEESTRRTIRWLAEQQLLVKRAPPPRRFKRPHERPDYYITPTHDFTQYTKDYEQQYWSQDTAFDWQQDVPANLHEHLERLAPAEFARLARLALPLVDEAVGDAIRGIRRYGLPLEEDALKAVRECVMSDRPAIDAALAIQAPLEQWGRPAAQLRDRLAILRRHHLELREQQRVGLFKSGTQIRQRSSAVETREQEAQLAALTSDIARAEAALEQWTSRGRAEREQLLASVRAGLAALEPQLLADLDDTGVLVRGALRSRALPDDAPTLARLRQIVWKRQLRGLKDIANHALVVEQSAIAPLTMGVIHYKRRREIQQAMTTFVNDEAKHSAVFRRFMAQKLAAKEHIPDAIITAGERYMWLARFLPSGGVFLAVIVEAIGAAFLDFFAREEHMPEPLFRSICQTIAGRDEKRHMDLCAATYNELYRTGSQWERLRNTVALRTMMKAAYGDKNEDHSLLRACRAFGIEPERPYQHVASCLSAQLARVGVFVGPAALLELMQLRRGAAATRRRAV
jgi:nucleoside-diphosphate-sugar epimerase